MATTYRKLADLIIDRHYNGVPSDDATITLRHVAELIAQQVAYFAKKSAFENSNAGEATYANDQFISTFNSLTLLVDGITKEKYITLPATPAGLPNNQEIVSVAFSACPNKRVVPLKQKDQFAQASLPMPSGIYTYKIENGRIVFSELGKLVTGDVSVKMVGALSGNDLLSSTLNIPKDVESDIMEKVLNLLDPRRSVPRDMLNDSAPIPA